MITYFVLSYATVAFAISIIKRWSTKRFPDKSVMTVLLIGALLSLPFVPYAVVNAQTAVFGKLLLPAVHQAYRECCGAASDKIFKFEVLWIAPWGAEVYLVTPCTDGMMPAHDGGRVAMVIDLNRTGGRWQYEDDDGIWSDCGSADGNIIPPDPQGGWL